MRQVQYLCPVSAASVSYHIPHRERLIELLVLTRSTQIRQGHIVCSPFMLRWVTTQYILLLTYHLTQSRSRTKSSAQYTISKINLVDLAGSERLNKTHVSVVLNIK